jgi:hypothetical protein
MNDSLITGADKIEKGILCSDALAMVMEAPQLTLMAYCVNPEEVPTDCVFRLDIDEEGPTLCTGEIWENGRWWWGYSYEPFSPQDLYRPVWVVARMPLSLYHILDTDRRAKTVREAYRREQHP